MALRPNAKKAFRLELAAFCRTAEACERVWHYTERRPYSGLGVTPVREHENDCSSYCALVFYYAGRAIGRGVADPLAEHYSGYGNTQTAIEFLKSHEAPRDKYRPGDMAIYGSRWNTKHMTVCRLAGTGQSSVWSSFGQESGPQTEALHYRDDLVGVYRHPALL